MTPTMDGVDQDSFYIILPPKLAERIDNPDETDGHGNNERKFIYYNPGVGYREIDLLYTNIRMFTSFDGGGSLEVTGLAVVRNTTRGLMNSQRNIKTITK